MRLRIALLAVVLLPSIAAAQGYPFSQRSTLTQNVALTRFTIEYGRPVARGRALWGALVPWDSVWHPGADSATTLAVDHDVTVNGSPLPAGRYSLWLIPRATAPWTVIFSKQADAFHKPYPGEANDFLRISATPVAASHMESMAIYFHTVLRDSALMYIHWGTTALPIRVKAPFAPK